MKNKKIGKFYISHNDLHSNNFEYALSVIKFIPLRVEFLAHRNQFEYIGLSHLFDTISYGSEVPTYTITMGDIGDISVNVQ